MKTAILQMLERLGAFVNDKLETLGDSIKFGVSALILGLVGLFRKRVYRRSELMVHIEYTGARSLPIILMLGLLIGASIVVQTTPTISRYGPAGLVAGVVGVSVLRTLGPLLAAIIFAGRVGAGFTAELGTMAVSEEILALETMGINPVGYLVAPRFMAAVLMLPCLTVVFDASALIGAALVGIYQFGISSTVWMDITRNFVSMSDFTFGLSKSVAFAFLITLICCYKGFRVKGSGMEVGRATMHAVVMCLILIIFSDFVLSMLYNFLHTVGLVG